MQFSFHVSKSIAELKVQSRTRRSPYPAEQNRAYQRSWRKQTECLLFFIIQLGRIQINPEDLKGKEGKKIQTNKKQTNTHIPSTICNTLLQI